MTDWMQVYRDLRDIRRGMLDVGLSLEDVLQGAREFIEHKRIERRAQERRDARTIGADPDQY